jgi:LmbE family N-acetylglucosaminyl deacetylase
MDLLGVDFLWLDHLDAVFRYRIPLSRFRTHVSKRGADAALGARLREDLRRICTASGARRLYAPLGVGQHVDHQIASRAAWELGQLAPDLFELVFYEEAPYAYLPGALRYRERLAGIRLESPGQDAGATPIREVVAGISAILAETPTLQIPRPFIVLAVSLGVLGLELFVALSSLARKHGPTLQSEIVDVTAFADAKIDAFLTYESQLHAEPAEIRRRYLEYSRRLGAGEGEARERYWHPAVPPGYPLPR